LVGWHYLPPDQLASRIRRIQYEATKRHLSERVWRTVDRMRTQLRYYQRLQEADDVSGAA
jgi:hypothetical protein